MYKCIACVVLLLCTVNSTFSLYFQIAETERKCFFEELPSEATVKMNYKMEFYDPRTNGYVPRSSNIGMNIEVRDSDRKLILKRDYSSEGRILFTSSIPGEHVICICSNSTAWSGGSQLRVHLDFQVGEHAIDYAIVAQREALSELELRLRQLLDQVEHIRKEQNYQRYAENRFIDNSNSTKSRVLWWLLIQTIIFGILGYLQVQHLKVSEAQESEEVLKAQLCIPERDLTTHYGTVVTKREKPIAHHNGTSVLEPVHRPSPLA